MRILANISKNEQPYQGQFKQQLAIAGLTGKATYKTYELGNLIALAKKVKAQAIFVTNIHTLKLIVNDPKPNLTNWRGSVLQTSIPIIIGDALYTLNSSPTGQLFLDIDLAKIKPAVYNKLYKYNYTICIDTYTLAKARDAIHSFPLIVSDIETDLHNQITSISFTEITEKIEVGRTYVISVLPSHYRLLADAIFAWQIIKEVLEDVQPKVFHNGCFDTFHLLRYNICTRNYIYDTEYIWRVWYAELQKGLDRISSYILPDFYQWKHESSISPLEYNAKDTINTARIFIKMLKHVPDWAWINYSQSFPNIGPVLYTAFEGMLMDTEKVAEARAKAVAERDQLLTELRVMLGLPEFNPGSPQQVAALLYGVLGAKKSKRAKSTTATAELELLKVARQNPFYAPICSRIIKIKELRKAISTYYDAQLTEDNRLLYQLSIDGTETGRMACNASSLRTLKRGKKTYVKSNMHNYGTQLQNLPPYLRRACKADPGYLFGNIDKSQSEARCTAYLANCKTLIEALENPPLIAGDRDFYCYTGLKFFGIEFNTKHPLRQVVKKIIHGTNYMMQSLTFIDSVGVEELYKYKDIINYKGGIKAFATHLLSLYMTHYPEVEKGWEATEKEVAFTGFIKTPDNWTRKVFGNIKRSHTIKRSVIAHKSQHFSVVSINEAFWKIFYNLQVPSNGELRLKGQVHDSIPYQAKIEKFDYYEKEILKIMDIPQETPAGIMRIPLDTYRGEYWK